MNIIYFNRTQNEGFEVIVLKIRIILKTACLKNTENMFFVKQRIEKFLFFKNWMVCESLCIKNFMVKRSIN